MGSSDSTPGDVHTGDEGQDIGKISTPGLIQLYIKDGITVVPSGTAPSTNPCSVTDPSLTVSSVMAEYPGFQWDPTKHWTAQSMQCWAYLAVQSKIVHPDRPFSQQYGFEPYLLI